MPAVERAVTLECAGNGRLAMRPLPTGEPWGDYAVSTARWTGVPLRASSTLAQPAADGVEVLFRGADHGPYHLSAILADTDQQDLTFERALPLDLATDPEAEILVAYEMNGEPLGSDHGAPFRLIVPHWYAVASVKWLKRIDVLTEPYTGEFQTGHYIYEWPDKPHERVDLMRVRARITDPVPGAIIPAGTYTVRGKAWSGTGPVTAVDVSLTGASEWYPAKVEPPKGPYQWQDWSFEWDGRGNRAQDTTRPRDRCIQERPAGNPAVEPARLREQRRRDRLRRRAVAQRRAHVDWEWRLLAAAHESLPSRQPCCCLCLTGRLVVVTAAA